MSYSTGAFDFHWPILTTLQYVVMIVVRKEKSHRAGESYTGGSIPQGSDATLRQSKQ